MQNQIDTFINGTNQYTICYYKNKTQIKNTAIFLITGG